jgi:hypothetical protein
MQSVSSGEGTAYPSGASEFSPVFSGVRVTRSLVLYECFVEVLSGLQLEIQSSRGFH